MFKCDTLYKEVMGIYKIKNVLNNKFYIGSAVNLHDRFLHHRKRLRGNYHNNKHLQRAFDKYGEDCFIFEVIEIVNDKDILLEREQHWLDSTQCCDPNIGYNLSNNATAPMLGIDFTEEHRKNLSKALKGMQQPEGFRERMSKLHKGKTLSEEHRAKLLNANKKYWTEENRDKQSKVLKERWSNPKFREKASKGTKLSDDDKKRISEMKKGSKHHNAKLTEEEVRDIKTMLKNGVDRKEIREKYDINVKNLSKIANGVTWSHVEV